jgi:predicted HTH domain antitoxin
MFLNDLEEFLLTKDIVGLKSITDELETELEIYLKIFVMLYADHTILLAESAEDLQVQLNDFGEYCDNWKMKVNVNKTTIMVFGFGKLRQNLKIT